MERHLTFLSLRAFGKKGDWTSKSPAKPGNRALGKVQSLFFRTLLEIHADGEVHSVILRARVAGRVPAAVQVFQADEAAGGIQLTAISHWANRANGPEIADVGACLCVGV